MALQKIKELKGILWRRIVQPKEKEEEIILPKFQVESPKTFVELPSAEYITKIDVRYPLILPFAYAHIKWEPREKQLKYFLEEPALSEKEKVFLDKISQALIDLIEVGLTSIKSTPQAMQYLEEQIKRVMKELSISISPDQYIRTMYYIFRNFVGLNEIEPLLRDPWLEDIGCDGVGVPIYVVHRKYGSIKTSVVFESVEKLREFVIKLSERCGRYVSYAEPILDGTLPDGSRVNATLAGDIATRGPTFSIRKFTERPFSPVDQIELGTISPLAMAYFWYLVENGASLLIAGGVATGKTSFLNSICMFIPPEAKIVSIEDTRELRIPHEHWIPTVTRLGFGIPMLTGEKYGEITLFDLLKGSFRQNPDYVIVGEVRGKEAYVMFQGMSSGHPCLATFHAGSVDTVIKRLTTPPIELSASLVESLDVIAIMVYAKERGKSARRIKEVDEIVSVSHETHDAEVFRSVEWDPKEDTFTFNKSSYLLQKIAHNRGITVEEAIEEITRRNAILEWMLKNGIKDYVKVCQIINEYYKSPEKILKQVGAIKAIEEVKSLKRGEVPKEKEKIEKEGEVKPKKVPISEIFKFKIISEK
ncbi:MAG: type II/IV secretion system ATPase subunit [Candidatus Aenigmarchaeota archaeon]|nr:type II/IV secretion system ATPase subunit [Candidatus Aenigmarchaeota archaeon]